MTTLSENESLLNNYDTIEIWDSQMLIKIMYADGLLKTTKCKIGGINTLYPNERAQMEAVLTKLFIKKPKPRAYTKKYLIELYNQPELFSNQLKVKYEYCKSHKMGRVYPVNSIGYCTTRKEIRHTLCKGKYCDIDIENAHPNILNQLTNKKHKILNDYCESREKYFDLICIHYSAPDHGIIYDWKTSDETKNMCKEMIISCVLYNGLYSSWENRNNLPNQSPPDFYNEIMEEMHEIHRVLIEQNSEFYLKLNGEKTTGDFTNAEGSLVSWLCQDSERKIQETKVLFLTKKKLIVKKNVVLCYDGEQIRCSHLIDDKLLRNLENEIMNVNNFTLKIKIKGFDNGFKPELLDFEMPNNSIEEVEEIVLSDSWLNLTPEELKEIMDLMNIVLCTPTDYDFAYMWFKIFGMNYVCSSRKHSIWWIFKNHKWSKTEGAEIRLSISTEYFELFNDYYKVNQIEYKKCGDIDKKELYRKQMKNIGEIMIKLKKTNDKSNIIKELMALCYEDKFNEKMDRNPYLLCCNNGVVDFKMKCLRDGVKEDYITLSTGIDYLEVSSLIQQDYNDLADFIEQIMPFENQKKYLIEHLASVLIGNCKNQALNYYLGGGSNGKSKLVELMSLTLGGYKGTIPSSLICGKRPLIGNTSSEIANLKGIRYAVIQEPSKGEIINEGVMKELTGGDPISCRQLYCEAEIFQPQFSLVVCANYKINVNSNDNGTWRRIKLVEFYSKFMIEDKIDYRVVTDDDGNEVKEKNNDLEFVMDKELTEKLNRMKIPFLSLLVNQAFISNGHVNECEMVNNATKRYRGEMNRIGLFVENCLIEGFGDEFKASKTEIGLACKDWFETNYKYKINNKELFEILDEKFDKSNNTYYGIKLNYNLLTVDKKPADRFEIFAGEFEKHFEVTNDKLDCIRSIRITEWAKLKGLVVSSSKEINPLLLSSYGLDVKNKEQYKTKKINGAVFQCWIGIKEILSL